MRRARLVIVDDEPLVTGHLARCLQDAGFPPPDVAHDEEQGARRIAAVRPDLVLMDIRLGDGDEGIALAGRVWQDWQVPVVFVTAYADERTVVQATRPGVFGFIVKPFSHRQLVATIVVALMRTREAARPDDGDRLARLEGQVRELTTLVRSMPVARDRLDAAVPDATMSADAAAELATLSAREREVLAALLDNRRVPAIAESLFISQHTVRNHLKSIFRKFAVNSQQALFDRLRQRSAVTLCSPARPHGLRSR